MSNTPVHLRGRHWDAAGVLDTALGMTQDDVNARLMAAAGTDSAGAHNAVYRGKSLGTAVTAAQYEAIDAGTFEDLYIGDYWTIGGVNWRIAAFDYWYHTGDSDEALATPHHVVIVPEESLYRAQMHNTEGGAVDPTYDTLDGAYVGSDMYTENLDEAKAIICAAFGESHVMTHREFFVNVWDGDAAVYGAWYDSTVDLMNELMVIGATAFSCQRPTADKTQLPLYAMNPWLISNGRQKGIWLRDVSNPGAYFCRVNGSGESGTQNATQTIGVKPAFAICAVREDEEENA